jgi:hypothetical protein
MQLFYNIGVYTASHIRRKPKLELLSTYIPTQPKVCSQHVNCSSRLSDPNYLPSTYFLFAGGGTPIFLDEDN